MMPTLTLATCIMHIYSMWPLYNDIKEPQTIH